MHIITSYEYVHFNQLVYPLYKNNIENIALVNFTLPVPVHLAYAHSFILLAFDTILFFLVDSSYLVIL